MKIIAACVLRDIEEKPLNPHTPQPCPGGEDPLSGVSTFVSLFLYLFTLKYRLSNQKRQKRLHEAASTQDNIAPSRQWGSLITLHV